MSQSVESCKKKMTVLFTYDQQLWRKKNKNKNKNRKKHSSNNNTNNNDSNNKYTAKMENTKMNTTKKNASIAVDFQLKVGPLQGKVTS